MILQDVLDLIVAGPVGDLPLGGGGSGVLPAEKRPLLGLKLDSALLALHTRFPLRLKTLELVTFTGRYSYPLEPKYALTDPGAEPQRFLLDSESEPFTGDVLAIERIYDGSHCPLPLNDREDPLSWFTPRPTTLSMDYPLDDTHYFVEYRARHPKLDTSSPSTEAVDVPDVLLNALLARVAYEAFCGQTGENATMKAQEQLAKYEAECALVEDRNSVQSSVTDTNTKFDQGGWV